MPQELKQLRTPAWKIEENRKALDPLPLERWALSPPTLVSKLNAAAFTIRSSQVDGALSSKAQHWTSTGSLGAETEAGDHSTQADQVESVPWGQTLQIKIMAGARRSCVPQG